jgi:hypothetical protein
MLQLAIGYAIGVVTVLLAVRYTNLQVRFHRDRLEKSLSRASGRMHELELEKAYASGQADQQSFARHEIQRLNREMDWLIEENNNLRDRINGAPFFDPGMLADGSAAFLHGDGGVR